MIYSEKNKRKIINDPVFGFIQINHPLLFDLIEHPIFQRLKRIRQLGLSSNVYPGAQHTRFQHALGAMHLTQEAVTVLRSKNIDISNHEELAVLIAILLHDIGHGPFSHVLEQSLVDISHEAISLILMEDLNTQFEGQLSLAIEIFKGEYHKKFLSQLVSGQLDMDRMDYLRRDSFYTGVTEGTIGSARIIKMLNVSHDELVLDAKAIYSIEKFLIARRLMYWQVYLHKTCIASERMLLNVLKRAKYLNSKGDSLFLTPSLAFFIEQNISLTDLKTKSDCLYHFINLDDNDIITCLKYWMTHPDKILSTLSQGLINRKLYKIHLQNTPFEISYLEKLQGEIKEKHELSDEDLTYFIFNDTISSELYANEDKIKILYKTGAVADIDSVSEIINLSQKSSNDKKYFVCHVRN